LKIQAAYDENKVTLEKKCRDANEEISGFQKILHDESENHKKVLCERENEIENLNKALDEKILKQKKITDGLISEAEKSKENILTEIKNSKMQAEKELSECDNIISLKTSQRNELVKRLSEIKSESESQLNSQIEEYNRALYSLETKKAELLGMIKNGRELASQGERIFTRNKADLMEDARQKEEGLKREWSVKKQDLLYRMSELEKLKRKLFEEKAAKTNEVQATLSMLQSEMLNIKEELIRYKEKSGRTREKNEKIYMKRIRRFAKVVDSLTEKEANVRMSAENAFNRQQEVLNVLKKRVEIRQKRLLANQTKREEKLVKLIKGLSESVELLREKNNQEFYRMGEKVSAVTMQRDELKDGFDAVKENTESKFEFLHNEFEKKCDNFRAYIDKLKQDLPNLKNCMLQEHQKRTQEILHVLRDLEYYGQRLREEEKYTQDVTADFKWEKDRIGRMIERIKKDRPQEDSSAKTGSSVA